MTRTFPLHGVPAIAAAPAVFVAVSLLVAGLAGAPPAGAQTFLWDGGGPDNQWSSGDNWDGGIAPSPGGSTIITMDGTLRTTNTQDIANPFQLNRLNIGNTGSSAFNIGGNQLQFVADGAIQPRIFSNRDATSTISAPVDIAPGTTLQLEVTTFHLNLNGVISGDGTLEKLSHAGGFNLNNGANSFSGGIIYRNFGGANGQWNLFRVTASGAMGTGLVQLDGGNLNPWNSATNNNPGGLILNGIGLSFANDFQLLRDSPISVGQPNQAGHVNNSATLTGGIDLNGNTLTLRGRGAGTITGQISGAGGVRKIEDNTWTVSGSHSYTGPTSILGGTLSIDTIANGGIASGLGAASNAMSNLVLGSGTLQYTGGSASTDRMFQVSSGANASFDITDPNANLTFTNVPDGGANWGGGGATLTKLGPGTLTFGRLSGAQFRGSIGSIDVQEGALLGVSGSMVQLNLTRQAGSGDALTLGDGATLGIATALQNSTAGANQVVRYTGTSETATISGGFTFQGPAGPDGGAFDTKTFIVNNGAADVDLRITSNIGRFPSTAGAAGQSRLIKAGEGTLELLGSAAYSGGTTVADGRLLVNNTSGSGTGTGDVVVEAGGVLGGTGIISPGANGLTLEADATLAPGNSPGTFTVNGDVLFGAGSFFDVDLAIGGVAASSTNGSTGTDLLVVNNGGISLDGALLTGTWGGDSGNIFRGDLTSDNMLWIMNNTGQAPIDGTFANSAPAPGFAGLFSDPLATPHLTHVDGQLFALFYDADFGSQSLSGGNDMLLLAVPEPGRALLVVMALATLGWRRRRTS